MKIFHLAECLVEPERARNVSSPADGHLVAADAHRVDGVEVVGGAAELGQVDLQVERGGQVGCGEGGGGGGQSKLLCTSMINDQ